MTNQHLPCVCTDECRSLGDGHIWHRTETPCSTGSHVHVCRSDISCAPSRGTFVKTAHHYNHLYENCLALWHFRTTWKRGCVTNIGSLQFVVLSYYVLAPTTWKAFHPHRKTTVCISSDSSLLFLHIVSCQNSTRFVQFQLTDTSFSYAGLKCIKKKDTCRCNCVTL